MDLLSVGEAFEDLIFAGLLKLPRPGEELRVPHFTWSVGGGAVITAVAAARLGLRCSLITALPGRAASAAVVREGVRVMNLVRGPDQSAISVALSTRRDRTFVTFEGVNRTLEPRLLTALRHLRRHPRHVHFALSPGRCAAWVPVVKRLRTLGATTSWDFGWNERLLKDRGFRHLQSSLDWLFVNEAEARLYRSVLRHANAVIKRGARGAAARCDGDEITSGPARARVVDTTGAGDAFNAGFLAAILCGSSPSQALRLGNYVGARSTEGVGGIATLPRRRTLPRWARKCLETT